MKTPLNVGGISIKTPLNVGGISIKNPLNVGGISTSFCFSHDTRFLEGCFLPQRGVFNVRSPAVNGTSVSGIPSHAKFTTLKVKLKERRRGRRGGGGGEGEDYWPNEDSSLQPLDPESNYVFRPRLHLFSTRGTRDKHCPETFRSRVN